MNGLSKTLQMSRTIKNQWRCFEKVPHPKLYKF